jgi:ABC-2 type transport system ATP-binding protein
VSDVTLAVRGVSKRFGELQALDGVGFEARAGEIVALVGPNGAGKTTLLSIVAGIERADAGKTVPEPARVGWAPQQAAIYSRLTVTENLALFARLERVADVEAAVAEMLAQTGLQERAAELTSRLSGGNRQRVNVAIALLGSPPVLALDEPSASLDPAQRERLWEFLSRLAAAGTTIVFSSHHVAEAQRHAHRVVVLDAGRLEFDGTPVALLRAAGDGDGGDLERALVRFLAKRERGRA